MKIRAFAFIVTALSLTPLLSADINFKDIARQQQMTFTMPADFLPVPVIENGDMRYDYAIRHKTKKLEIRYAVFGLKTLIEQYEKSKSNPSVLLTDPNKRFTAFTYSACLNISGGAPFKGIKAFKPGDVKKEFNADGGATIFIEPKSEFGKKFKYVLVIALHKDSVADSYIFYLFDDMKSVNKEISGAFHALTYR